MQFIVYLFKRNLGRKEENNSRLKVGGDWRLLIKFISAQDFVSICTQIEQSIF